MGCCLLLFLTTPAQAQDTVIVEAEADRTVLTTDERMVLTITVQGGQPDSPPILPPLQAARVVGQQSATQITSVGGTITAVAAYRYTLQPLQVGEFRIDPISVVVNGQTYQTNPISFIVQQGTAPIDEDTNTIVLPTELNGQDFYLEASVDNLAPYLGEQVLYIFRFYRAIEPLGRINPDILPDFVGFWNSNEFQRVTSLAEVNGRTYQVITQFQPIFPTTTGELTIEPAQLEMGNLTLVSEAVTLNVRPLPEPAPDNFSGAVGQFEILAAAEPTNVEVGESVMLRAMVRGAGNIDTLPEPTLPELEGWRNFENQSGVSKEFSNNVIQGARTYERFLIPSEPGNVLLPAIEYVYFNPQTEQYETSVTDAFALTVVGTADSAAESTTLTEEESSAIALQPQKVTPNRLVRNSWRLTHNTMFWLLWLLPLLMVVGDKLLRIRESRVQQIEEERKRSNAIRFAQQALKAARIDKAQRADEAAERILTTYLKDKYNQAFAGMSQVSRAEALRVHNVRESRIRWVNHIYEQVQQTRYGFDAPERGKLLDEVDQVIRQMERGEDDGGGK